MKILRFASILLFVACTLQAAPKDKTPGIPKEGEGRWGVFSFEDAKKEAAKKKQPLAILIVNERAEEPEVKEAGQKAFWGIAKDASVVVVMSNLLSASKPRVGDQIYDSLTNKDLGAGFPRVIVFDQTGATLLGQMNAEQLTAADEKGLKTFIKQMDEANKNPAKAAPVVSTPSTPATATANVVIKDGKVENWTNAKGQVIQAILLEVSADTATFQLANGSKAPVAINTLSPESQKKVEELKASAEK